MDARIPKQWRLQQFMDFSVRDPESYPVFVKPEWGQNSQGITRVDNLHELQLQRQQRLTRTPFYLIQQAAPGKREFEIFIIPKADDLNQFALFSITETCNRSGDKLPVNGIYNKDSYYQQCHLSMQRKEKIWAHLKQIGPFRISRYAVRADSLEQLINGQFHIVEINLFVPMPLILLVQEVSMLQKMKFIQSSMKLLVAVTKTIPETQPVKAVFFKKLQSAQLLRNITKSELSS